MTSPTSPDERSGPTLPTVLVVLAVAAVVGFLVGALLATTTRADAPPAAASPTATGTPPASTGAPTASTPPEPTEPSTTWALALEADRSQAAPRELIRLQGRLDPARADVALQVQRSRDGGPYEDFPVTTTTGSDGSFGTWVRTQREGSSQFRVVADIEGEQVVSNVVVVQIG